MEVRQVQYRALTEPISQAPEVEHVDAFWRQPNEPVREVPRSLAALAAAGSFFMVLGAPTVEPPEDVFPDKYWQPASEPVRQTPRPVSEGMFVIVLTEDQRPEEITQDKWWRPASEPVRPIARALDEGGYFNDNIGRDEEPHPDALVFKWEFPRRILRVPLGDAVYPPYQEEAAPEDITLDKWFVLTEKPILRRLTPPSGLTEPVSQEPGDLPPVEEPSSFSPTLTVVTFTKTVLYQARFEVAVTEEAPPEDVTFDKWYRPPTEPTRRRPFAEGILAFDWTGRGEEIFPDKWWRPASEPTRLRERPLDEGGYFSDLIGRAEEITQDKWWRPSSEPMRLRRRNPETGETPAILGWFVSDEQITVDKWFRLTDNPVLRRLKPHEWFTIAPNSDGEAITLDKWWRPANEPVLRRSTPPTGETAPPLDAIQVDVTVEWWMPASEPVRQRERAVDVGLLAYLTEPTIYVLPNLEWWMPASEPVRFRALLRVGPMEWRSYEFIAIGFPGRIVFRDEAALIRFAESSASLQLIDTIGNTSVFHDDAALVGMWDEAVGEITFSDEVPS